MWTRCSNCNGSGKVLSHLDKNGKWVMKTCPACGGSGKVNPALV